RAIAATSEERRNYRKRQGIPHEEIWCVFDDDERPEAHEAVERAEREGIKVAFSSPYVELWFVLHFEQHGGWVSGDQIQRRSLELLGCKKNLTEAALDMLCDRYGEARHRAQQLTAANAEAGLGPHGNPSSSLWKLIDSLRRV
ncbi:MAG TPA: RloB family protein, partial [Candidatus Dormibacteraeota bacterium]|nr:RloB family protein [Candidatus Dormibacteraeota bacterium]